MRQLGLIFFLPQKSIEYAVLKTVLYDQCHVIMHIILQGSYDHFFAKKKTTKKSTILTMTTLHNGEKKTTVSSTLLLLVLLLCSSNTESASYGDRNQGGAIFYCANTEKVVL